MPETFPSPQHTRSWASLSSDAEDVRSLEHSAPEDPFGSEPDENRETTEEEGLNREPKKSVRPAELRSQGPDNVPVNPFHRTLATLEDPSYAPAKSEKDRMGSDLAEKPSNNAKASLDVDAFKRLLLTGDTSALPPSAPSTPPTPLNTCQGNQGNQGDSSSNTDASSVSRQSIFEPHPEAHADSPRTSHEVSLSDDENEDPGGVSFPSAMRTGRLTPKPRSGNVIKEQGPRTVPFTDPTLSFAGVESTSTTHRNDLDLSYPRSTTDLNKPLPPPPSSQSAERKAITIGLSIKSAAGKQTSEVGGLPTSQKRNPPAPPLARRHSQLRSQNILNSPERSVAILEENQAKSTLFQDLPSTTPPKPPPPPPPRRKGAPQSIQSSEYAPGPSEVPVTMAQAEQSPDRSSVKVQPVKPPRPPTRTPSVSSIKRPARVSSGASSTAMAPPPPPPRRRGSSQSSLTDPRPSGEYRRTSIESYREDSTASSLNPSIPESSAELEAGGGDVLADLSALQREVDALRGKFERAG